MTPAVRTHGPHRAARYRVAAWGGAAVRLVRDTLPVRCLRRFSRVNGRDRILALAGQFFTTLVPLTILFATVGSSDGAAVADDMIERFHVQGTTAESMRMLFRRPPAAGSPLTIVGAVVLGYSVVSLTRALQRTYEAAWELPPLGLRGTASGLTGTGLLMVQLVVLAVLGDLARRLPGGDLVSVPVRLAAAVVMWLVLQDYLLSHRVALRSLFPGAVVAGTGLVVVSIYSALWMPRLIDHNTERYGLIGITFAMLTWLIVLAAGIVLAAVVSAEIGSAGLVARSPGHPGRVEGGTEVTGPTGGPRR